MNTEDILDGDIKKCIETLLQERKIVEYTLAANTVLERNYVSTVTNVVVCGKNHSGLVQKLNFFIKTAKKERECREFLSIKDMYSREIYTYKYIIPQFIALQKERKIKNLFKFTKFYSASEKESKEMVILENLSKKGFKTIHKNISVDYNHAMLVMQELGKFHALSFALRDHFPSTFNEIFNNIDDIEFHGNLGQTSKLFLEQFYPLYIEIMYSGNHTIAFEKLNDSKEHLFKSLQTAVKGKTTEPYSVVTHGDFWIANLLFKYDMHSHPKEMRIVDFQTTKMASPVSDISQFLFGCLDQKIRNKHYNELIQEYYKSFSSFLQDLGSDPVQLFPYDVLQDQLKRFSVIGLYLAFKIICFSSIPTEDTPKYENAKNGKDSSKMFYDTVKNSNSFKENIKNVILDYIQLGYDL
ncbi:hypothetical protein RN001_013449 [Aquatica leii]|uniref:CHK kinase-like domain-containing protein n=1 Tax=Aquatica leii TaxID=1421715 RepID=A0AAN7P043_9COLE|nr:hypothetical protein RN001_013449 [Aquatica leii]